MLAPFFYVLDLGMGQPWDNTLQNGLQMTTCFSLKTCFFTVECPLFVPQPQMQVLIIYDYSMLQQTNKGLVIPC